jgi:hypothetical protein
MPEAVPVEDVSVVAVAAWWGGLGNRARLRVARTVLEAVTVQKVTGLRGKQNDRVDVIPVEPFPADQVAFLWAGVTGDLPAAS